MFLLVAASGTAGPEAALGQYRGAEPRPALPEPGPVTKVLGGAGLIVGFVLGGRRKHSKKEGEWKWPILYGLGGGAVGGWIGMAIDYPVTRVRNAAAMRNQSCVDTAGFIRRRGGDTLLVESVTFTGATMTGIQASRSAVTRYTATLTADLVVLRLDVDRWPPGHSMDEHPSAVARYRLHGDTITFWSRGLVGLRHTVHAQSDVAPLLDGATGLEELLTRRAALHHDALDVPTFDPMGDGYIYAAHIRFTGADSVEIRLGDGAVADTRIDGTGRIRGPLYRTDGSDFVSVERVRCGVVEPIINAYRSHGVVVR